MLISEAFMPEDIIPESHSPWNTDIPILANTIRLLDTFDSIPNANSI